jgi:hypothetical protein
VTGVLQNPEKAFFCIVLILKKTGACLELATIRIDSNTFSDEYF